MIGKNISGVPYMYGNSSVDRSVLYGKIIDKISVPFKHEIEVIRLDAYLVVAKEGYAFVVLPMDIQAVH